MSSQPQQPQNTNDEVDLGQLFRLIGDVFNRFINFIGSIFKAIFSVFIYGLKAIVVNFKIIVISLIVAGLLGYGLQKLKPNTYESTMLVKTYYDSKYQLVDNINYYNSLVAEEDYTTLSEIFEVNEDVLNSIVSFEIDRGPETENDQVKEYNKFLKSLDSVAVKDEITLQEFIDNRSEYYGDFFSITVTSLQKDIFPKLNTGLENSFTNLYSLKKKQKSDSLIGIQKKNILDQLNQVDSLQQVYIKVLADESQAKKSEISLGDGGFTLSSDKSNTKEYELLNKEIELRNQLKSLEERKVNEDVFFEVISSFQKVGKKTSKWYTNYLLVFPVLIFFILCGIYLTKKLVRYVVQYEA
ncbi:GumC domain-containing protein [Hanstruepera ponticola]|uniref:hypothetical protein n=1 Tax=Hanstruepera ponticola TaxID=2042995 RepID=UPI00177E66D7|nr:hypothetical protein [Hanstruepera ponticola]